ncbi:MAG: carbohydrate kinase family protein [bacterium]|nr:carbohydrate kinase family protein [bacterium]
MKYHVITIGRASQDIFLTSKAFRPSFIDGEPFTILAQGEETEISEIITETGGSATNAGVTFARQGLKTACVTKIGLDSAGREILHILKKEKISQNLIVRDTHYHTAVSTYLLSSSGETTRMVYFGNSKKYLKKDFNLHKFKAHWFYITSVGGDLKILSAIFNWADKKRIKVAINPSVSELAKPRRLLKLLKQADIVILNNEELGILSKYEKPINALRAVRDAGLKTVVMTDGENGSWVLGGDTIYHSKIYKKVARIDETGIGDAYGSAFVASIIKNKSIKEAMTLASANATSVIHYIGAKAGILRNPVLKQIKISQRSI